MSIALLLASIIGLYAQETSASEIVRGRYTTPQHTFADDKVLWYDLYIPPAEVSPPNARLPMLVMMHGAGAMKDLKNRTKKSPVLGWGKRMLKLNPAYSEDKYPLVIVEPLANPEWCKKCWDEFGGNTGSHVHDLAKPPTGIALVLELIPLLVKKYDCDPDRVYLCGISNGGYAAWDLITYDPGLFAAAIPICGAGDPSKAERLIKMPIWAFHGEPDGVVPTKGTKDMIAAIEAASGKPKVTYFPGVGHTAWNPTWKTPELLPWMFGQVKTKPTTGTSTPQENRP